METNLKQFVESLFRDDAYADFMSSSMFYSEYTAEPREWGSDEEKEFRAALTEAGVVCQHEDNYGGEGQGDDYWSVYSFTRGDEKVYVKFNGWYASYNGAEFTEWFFVEPKEKVITVFEPVS
jgi:hypothetical protein